MKPTSQKIEEKLKTLNSIVEIPLKVVNDLSDLFDNDYITTDVFTQIIDLMFEIQKNIVTDMKKLSSNN